MARSWAVIYNQMVAQKQAQASLSNLTSTSQVSKWNIWAFIFSLGQAIYEQLNDLFKANLESQITNAPVYSPQWIVQQLLNFQYSATTPQVISVIVSAVYPYVSMGYAVINSAFMVVVQAAVQINNNRSITIKVAGAGPAPLDGSPGITGPICTALSSYLNAIMIPGTQWQLLNADGDLVFLQSTAYFDASYSGVIEANLLAAFEAFLAAIPFNGSFEVSQLIDAMMAVPGMKDYTIQNLKVRLGSSSWPSGTYLVQASTLIQRNWATYAGYALPETQSGEDFISQLTTIAA